MYLDSLPMRAADCPKSNTIPETSSIKPHNFTFNTYLLRTYFFYS